MKKRRFAGLCPQTAYFIWCQGDLTLVRYILRRLLIAIPTLLVISFVIFAILDLAPNDPTGNLPMTVPPETREKIRLSLGLGEAMHVRYYKWLIQFFVNEPEYSGTERRDCYWRFGKSAADSVVGHAQSGG